MGTFASMFTCGGGADAGARAAGLTHIWGIEIDPRAASIAQLNGFSTKVADVLSINFNWCTSPDWLHASPPCTRASAANPNADETMLDIALSAKVIDAVEVLRPKVFSLENVQPYKAFKSYKAIIAGLHRLGYSIAVGTLNTAAYGVPQTRRRLFVVARRGVKSALLPMPTHQPSGYPSMLFADFVGWEAAIAHLPQPEVYDLSHRMVAMVPEGFTGRLLASGWHQQGARGAFGLTLRRPTEPAATLTAKASQPSLRPMIIEWNGDDVEARVLDVAHLAALQSFPPDYLWGDNPTTAIAAIGNSVAPLLMQKIIEANSEDLGTLTASNAVMQYGQSIQKNHESRPKEFSDRSVPT